MSYGNYGCACSHPPELAEHASICEPRGQPSATAEVLQYNGKLKASAPRGSERAVAAVKGHLPAGEKSGPSAAVWPGGHPSPWWPAPPPRP